jgi:hypothetical protein
MKHGAVRGRPNAVFVKFCAVGKDLRAAMPAPVWVLETLCGVTDVVKIVNCSQGQ